MTALTQSNEFDLDIRLGGGMEPEVPEIPETEGFICQTSLGCDEDPGLPGLTEGEICQTFLDCDEDPGLPGETEGFICQTSLGCDEDPGGEDLTNVCTDNCTSIEALCEGV
jgi:hypothetical protein